MVSWGSGDYDEEGEVDDWCLVCKDGGELLLCEFPECERAYHSTCLRKSNTLPTSLENWHCPRHSCLSCKRTPTVALCYSCPSASCSECLDALGFVRIHDKYGFCPKCLDLVMYFEGLIKNKPTMKDRSHKFEHLKEYYWIIKEKYGVTVDDLVAVKKDRKKQKEMKGRGKHGEVKGREKRKNWGLVKSDEDKELKKMKLNSAGTSQNEVLRRDVLIRIPALTHDNVQRIYLTRSVIQKLLMEPDSFEENVRRTFVGIELPKKARSNKITRQLVQVTGITKTSFQDDQICIKLQVKNRQDDISVDMVSDMDFQEYLCEDLRQQVKDGLIEMPHVDEFERMAKVLSEVLVDDYIVRETRKLQQNMNRAHEKGHKQEFLLLAQKKKELQTPNKKLQLIRYFQEVEVEEILADTASGNTVNVTPHIEPFSESVPNYVLLSENNMIDSAPRPIAEVTMDDKKQKENPPKLIPGSLELKTEKSSGCCGSKEHDMEYTDIDCRHQPMVDDNKQAVDAAGDQVREIIPTNVTDEVIVVADHSSIQSFGVENACNALLLSRGDVLKEQKWVDVMLEEFENNAHVVNDTQVELLRIEGFSAAEKLASLEQKVDCILQKMDRLTEKAAKQIVLK